MDLIPYLAVVNAGNRENVLRYDFVGVRDDGEGPSQTFRHGRQMPLFPSIGIDFRF